MVNDPGLREWQLTMHSIDKLLPGDVAFVAAPAQPVSPRTLGMLENDFEPLEVATYGSYVDNSTSTPYRPRETVASTEGER